MEPETGSFGWVFEIRAGDRSGSQELELELELGSVVRTLS